MKTIIKIVAAVFITTLGLVGCGQSNEKEEGVQSITLAQPTTLMDGLTIVAGTAATGVNLEVSDEANVSEKAAVDVGEVVELLGVEIELVAVDEGSRLADKDADGVPDGAVDIRILGTGGAVTAPEYNRAIGDEFEVSGETPTRVNDLVLFTETNDETGEPTIVARVDGESEWQVIEPDADIELFGSKFEVLELTEPEEDHVAANLRLRIVELR